MKISTRVAFHAAFIFSAILFYGCASNNETAMVSEYDKTPLNVLFDTPPDEVKPACFWWWLNSLVDKEGITRDLEEFKDKGMGGVMLVCSSNWGGPSPDRRGPEFLSEGWLELFKHAVSECDRLGLEFSANFCGSGWAMGGAWITPEYNGRWFVQSEFNIEGPVLFNDTLPMPDPRGGYKPPHHLMVSNCMNWPKEKMDYRDNAVVAVKVNDFNNKLKDEQSINLLDLKSNRRDASVFISANEVMNDPLERFGKVNANEITPLTDVIDLTDKISADGKLNWSVPEGKWVIVRTGHVATGSPLSLVLPEFQGTDVLAVDWLNPKAVDVMFDNFGNKLIAAAGDMTGRTFKYWHTDSFEDGYPNWSDDLTKYFRETMGYDPVPYLPVLSGRIIESADVSDRFLYDYRKCVADMFANGCLKRLRDRAHEVGMQYQGETGGPSWSGRVCIDALKNLGMTDVPMGEFWKDGAFVTDNQNVVCKQTSSAAHIYGKRMAAAESFTSVSHWREAPGDLKLYVDRAFCEGINRIVFHTMTSGEKNAPKPGNEYGAGTHFNPNVTWWDMGAEAWIGYINRCSALLNYGKFKADVLYYNGDWAPNLVDRKKTDPSLGKGYDYDVCNADVLLNRASVKNGRIVLPDGMSYSVLVLPDKDFMPVEVIKKIDSLVKSGATVIGPRPNYDPGLKNYPDNDAEVKKIAAGLWGDIDGKSVKVNKSGKGTIVYGKTVREVLTEQGFAPDFTFTSADSEAFIDYIHRGTDSTELYFIANRNPKSVKTECNFRASDKQPQLWNPVTGVRYNVEKFSCNDGITSFDINFEPHGSWFVVFGAEKDDLLSEAPHDYETCAILGTINEKWSVAFDKEWIYPMHDNYNVSGDKVVFEFDTLTDWSMNKEEAVKYYSGEASYDCTFNISKTEDYQSIKLNLGVVKNLARVTLNGKDLGVVWCEPWSVDITDVVSDSDNTLTIDVVNFWPNRLIGDATLNKKMRKTATNMAVYNKDSELMSSGLLGPVTVVGYK